MTTLVADTSIKALVNEAKALFNVLDSVSDQIRNIENNLQEINANFPFSHSIEREYNSQVQKYCEWCFEWKSLEGEKKFRLFLTCQRGDYTTGLSYPDGMPEEVRNPLAEDAVYMKPLIETDLSMRLRFAQHLCKFVEAYTAYLKKYRQSIEDSIGVPF